MASRPLLFKYPLDLSGKNPNNLVINEEHLIGGTAKGVFVPNGGPFYVDSVVIVNAGNGVELIPKVDYLILQPYQEASVKSGLDVASVIYVKNKAITDVLITYQVVGGEFSWTTYALNDMLVGLDLDNRPVAWGDIVGKPSVFPPTPHLHDLGDTYGWEYVTAALENIYRAILIGDEASHDELRQMIVTEIANLKAIEDQAISNLDSSLDNHLADFNNPHKTSKAQVGLSLVENFPPASAGEASAMTATDRYMTPSATKTALATFKSTLGNSVDRNFFVSTSNPNPTQGKDGDIWLKYI